jgi:hypothetical protein
MNAAYVWDEAKRQTNLLKHGLDFADAAQVLENPYRLEVSTERNGEARLQSLAFVFERLAVLTVVTFAGNPPRIISFRPASRAEREYYHDWLENDFDGS